MANGYNNKILRVDLSGGTISVDEPEENFYRRYLGGRGLVGYYLNKEMKGDEDPLGPENKLIFATGPITGLSIAGAGRNSVGARSPLTGGYGDGEVGGYWGAELKHAGYDAIIIEGKAEKPVYLWIEDGKAEIKAAGHIWGKKTAECEKIIKKELGDNGIRVAQIGIAGENQVRFACVINDISHAAGRSGLGAVMGSKNLRAIAVRGHGKVAVADEEGVEALLKQSREELKANLGNIGMAQSGTAGILMLLNTAGGLPTRNFQQGAFEGAEKISADALNETILVRRRGCFACPIQCKPEVATGEPYNVDPTYGGPEYEALGSFGSNCGIDDLPAISKAAELSNACGLDVISTGVSIAFAMDCFERGILTEKDTGGLKLNFGNAEAMVKLVEMIARKEGLGKVLAEGVARAAEAIGNGAEECAMHANKQEIPMHSPRFRPGMGVGYAVSVTGADHVHNMWDNAYTQNTGRLKDMGVLEPLPREELSPAKVRLLIYGHLWPHIQNCLTFCGFAPMSVDRMIELLKAVTGWNINLFELNKIGERCITMARAFNVRAGRTKKDDRLPHRFFTPFESGPLAGAKLDEAEFEQAVGTYYAMMGWDEEGKPTLAKLQELGVGWVAGV